jgi:archaellum component FlaC
MKIEKANWGVNGNKISLAVPLTKVDKERRLVHGFASLDNIDTQNDLVSAEASSRAFSRFRGNIREMHQPIAVGKMVSFVEDTFYDKNTDKHYKGVFVSAYVSKGAPDTWEKVLDGTLTGFSIGGEVLDSEEEFNKDAGVSVRKVTDYSLTELSLVDNPANQLANIASFEKVAGETVVKGSIATMDSATAFYCYEDAIAKVSVQDSEVCPNCGDDMSDIGWFEYSDVNEKNVKLSETVKKYLETNNMQATAINEGGVDVAEDTVEKNARPEEAGPITEPGEAGQVAPELASSVDNPASDLENAPAEVSEVEEVDEEATEDVSEVDKAEDDLTKMFNGFREQMEKVLAGNVTELNDAVLELTKRFDEFTKSADEKIEGLKTEHTELKNKFATVAEDVEKVEKSIKTLNSEGAMRKSNDLGGSGEESETVEKGQTDSLWGGHFLGIDSLR